MNDTYNMTSSDQWEHLLFNENPLIIVQYDTDLNILACNKMMEEIAGEQWKKVVGLNLKSLKEQRILPAAEAALRGEKGHYEGEYISHYQNKKFWIKLNTVPLPDQNNKIVGGLAFMHNLTEFNQIKNDLQIQKSFFENLFESSPDAITILDPDDRVLQINKQFTTLFGFNEDEVIGRQINDLLVPPHLKEEGLKATQTVAEGNTLSLDTVRQTKDGRLINVAIVGKPIMLNDNKLAVYGIYRDISEAKRIEEVLRDNEEKYRMIVENARNAIVISQQDHFIFINQAFADMLGYTVEELENCDYRKVYSQEGLEILFERTRRRAAKENVPARYETIFVKKDGTKIDVEATVSIIEYRGHKATFAVIRDISEEKRLYHAMIETLHQTEHLGNFIPICANCKKIRDDSTPDKQWIDPELYIASRLKHIKFSHGICPTCMKILYPKFAPNKKNESDEK
jgi:PAS domain S-box-containing protein